MIIKIKKTLFQESLNIVKLGIANNPILPILEEIKVTVSDGKMKLQATDNKMAITLNVDCEVEGGGSFTLTKKAIDLIPGLKSTDVVLTLTEKTLKITQGKSTYKFPIGDPDDFPSFKTEKDFESSIEVEYANFKQTLIDTLPFCTTNEAQAAMTGVFMELSANTISLSATNAHILSNTIIDSPTVVDSLDERSVILPSSFVKVLKSIRLSPEFCKIMFSENMICVCMDNLNLSCRLIDENYPNYKAVIPKQEVGFIEFNTDVFLASLKRLALLANQTTKQAALVYSSDGVALAVNDLDFDIDAVEIITDNVDAQMGSGHIGLNISFLISILPTLKNNRIRLTFSGKEPNKPILIKESSESIRRTTLVMPVMMNEDNFNSIREKIK